MAELAPGAQSAHPIACNEAARQPGDFPSIARACYALGVFIFAYFLYFSDVQLITLLVAPIEKAYRINDTSFSLLAAGPPIIAILATGLPMAGLVDRRNRRNLLAVAILLWTAMNVSCAFAPSFAVLFALKVGVAIGGVWYYPTVVSLLSDLFAPRHRTTAFTLLQLCGTSGVGLAVLMSGGAIALAHRLSTIVIPVVGTIAWAMVLHSGQRASTFGRSATVRSSGAAASSVSARRCSAPGSHALPSPPLAGLRGSRARHRRGEHAPLCHAFLVAGIFHPRFCGEAD